MFVLVASDGVQFKVDKDILQRSTYLKNMLEDLGDRNEAIPLHNVSSPVLKKVLAYCKYHRREPLPSTDIVKTQRARGISEWDQKFISVDTEMLFEIILAANYLDIESLLFIGCTTVTKMIRGKSPNEIRKLFNISSFTPEEEAQIQKENEWAEDR